MSSQHTTMEATYKAAEVTKASALATAQTAFQTTIDVAKSAVGYIPGLRGTEATFQAAVAAANRQLAIDRATAEHNKQVAHNVARDTMRSANTGEVQ